MGPYDFRKVNKVLQFDAYPMPWVQELLEKLGKAAYLSTLDMTKGYWQIPLERESKQYFLYFLILFYTAFATPVGLFQFTRMPFGLHFPIISRYIASSPTHDMLPHILMMSLYLARVGRNTEHTFRL